VVALKGAFKSICSSMETVKIAGLQEEFGAVELPGSMRTYLIFIGRRLLEGWWTNEESCLASREMSRRMEAIMIHPSRMLRR